VIVAQTRAELVRARADLPEPVAVVMTMGALHAGHAALIEQARQRAASVVVTIFLNPLQFAVGEDLGKYPRTLDSDLAMCRSSSVDVVFAPEPDEVYPAGEPTVRVDAGEVGDRLEGTARPGHFDGVLTVVAKLLNLTGADLAYFGRKDAQQLWLITRMVRDLDLPVEIVPVATVRDGRGLALSSRNGYLSDDDRLDALALPAALGAGKARAGRGPAAVVAAATRVLVDAGPIHVDYVELVDANTFDRIDPATPAPEGSAILLVAAQVGSTRLIDNTLVSFGDPGDHDDDAEA
jgi:pantoate--beta-alanine ligase